VAVVVLGVLPVVVVGVFEVVVMDEGGQAVVVVGELGVLVVLLRQPGGQDLLADDLAKPFLARDLLSWQTPGALSPDPEDLP
jgi:hypothetical protein